MTKDKVIASLDDLPDEFELEDLFERLRLIQRIDYGRQQVALGEVVSEEEARQYLRKWLD
jgi:hypothetical protein